MPQITRTGGSTATRGTDEQFLELLCADEDLLRAEFDAIIAAEWPSPAASRSQRPGTAKPATPPTHRRVGPATLTPALPAPDSGQSLRRR